MDPRAAPACLNVPVHSRRQRSIRDGQMIVWLHGVPFVRVLPEETRAVVPTASTARMLRLKNDPPRRIPQVAQAPQRCRHENVKR